MAPLVFTAVEWGFCWCYWCVWGPWALSEPKPNLCLALVPALIGRQPTNSDDYYSRIVYIFIWNLYVSVTFFYFSLQVSTSSAVKIRLSNDRNNSFSCEAHSLRTVRMPYSEVKENKKHICTEKALFHGPELVANDTQLLPTASFSQNFKPIIIIHTMMFLIYRYNAL